MIGRVAPGVVAGAGAGAAAVDEGGGNVAPDRNVAPAAGAGAVDAETVGGAAPVVAGSTAVAVCITVSAV